MQVEVNYQANDCAEPISDELYCALCLILLPSKVRERYPLKTLELCFSPERLMQLTYENAYDAIVQGGLLSDRSLRLLACDCAEWVLPNFEQRYPNDTRPRNAISVARRFAYGWTTYEELDAASSAASSAAYSAADRAASSAAYRAASSAACQTLSFFLSHYLRLEWEGE